MLTKQRIESAKAKDKPYLLPDDDGLYLRVFPTGTKKWVVRMYAGGKAVQRTIGEYPAVGLLEARKIRNRVKDENSAGRDTCGVTLREMTDKWLQEYTRVYAKGSEYNHRLYVSYLDRLLDRGVKTLTRRDLVEQLKRVRDAHSYDTARRVAVALGQIYKHAMNAGLIDSSPAVALSSALPATKEERAGKHFATVLDVEGIGRLLRCLDTINRMTIRLALWFLAYTFPRSQELRFATWSEIDGAVWHIPAEHTKRRKALDVPLSRQALEILQTQRQRTRGAGYIFPSDRTGGMISKFTLLSALKNLRTLPDEIRPAEMTVHGFRAMASTILNESGLWTPDAIERQLSHTPENDVRAAYNRGEYWEERVKLMQWYADKLDELCSPKKC